MHIKTATKPILQVQIHTTHMKTYMQQHTQPENHAPLKKLRLLEIPTGNYAEINTDTHKMTQTHIYKQKNIETNKG